MSRCELDLWPLDLELLQHFGSYAFKLCTKFERNRIIYSWVIDDLARFRRAILGGGAQLTDLSQGCVDPTSSECSFINHFKRGFYSRIVRQNLFSKDGRLFITQRHAGSSLFRACEQNKKILSDKQTFRFISDLIRWQAIIWHEEDRYCHVICPADTCMLNAITGFVCIRHIADGRFVDYFKQSKFWKDKCKG